MLGHPLVRDAELSLWIDNAIVLEADPCELVTSWLTDSDMAMVSHSYRATLLDEFFVVLDDELDDPNRILEQLEHYARSRPEVLDERPLWGGMIARRWSPAVDEAMRAWWEQVLRYSRRDQLSLLYALDAVALAPTRIEIDNYQSDWHRWPVAPERNGAMRTRSSQRSLGRPLARSLDLARQVEQLQAQTEELRRGLHRSNENAARSEQQRHEFELRLRHTTEIELPAVTAELDRVRDELAVVAEQRELARSGEARLQQAERDLAAEAAALRRELDAIHRSWTRRFVRSIATMMRPFRRG